MDFTQPKPKRSTDSAEFLRILHANGGVFEVRIPKCPTKPGGTYAPTASGYFTDPDAATKAIQRVEQRFKPPAIYVTLNSCKPDVLARANGRINADAKSTTKDEEITCRRWLLVDCDPDRPADVSSTEAEMQASLEFAENVRDTLAANHGFPEPLFVMTGNGAALLYLIDLPNDEAATDLVVRVIAGMKALFDTPSVHIDDKVTNAARIGKVAGTMTHKGDDLRGVEGVEDRPHRQSWFIRPKGALKVVSREMLESIAVPKPKSKKERKSKGANVVERCWAYVQKLPDAISGQGGHKATFHAACECFRFGLSDADALTVMEWFNAVKTGGKPWTESELKHKIEDAKAEVKAAGDFGRRLEPVNDEKPDEYYGTPPSQVAAKEENPTPRTSKTSKKSEKSKVLLAQWQEFPEHALPEAVRTVCRALADAIHVDISLIVLPVLVAAAGCIGNRRRLRVQDTWYEPCVLWGAIVAESGGAKTPVLANTIGAIKSLQGEYHSDYVVEMEEFQRQRTIYERDLANWKKDKSHANQPPPEEPEAPIYKQIWVDDVTIEALAPMLVDNLDGVILAVDELTSWAKGFNQYKGRGGADQSKWLSVWSAQPIQINRRTNNQRLHIPNAVVSVIGGIQPEILRDLFSPENFHSGFAARILLTWPPKRFRNRKKGLNCAVHAEQLDSWYKRLLRMAMRVTVNDRREPFSVGLSRDADDLFDQFHDEVEAKLQVTTGAFSSMWSKMRNHALRLALVIAYLRWVSTEGLEEPTVIGSEDMANAIILARWFGNESERVYRILCQPPEFIERNQLIDWIKSRGGTVTERDVYTILNRQYPTAADAEKALSELVNLNHGIWQKLPPGEKGGRPSRKFILDAAHMEGASETSELPEDSEVPLAHSDDYEDEERKAIQDEPEGETS